MFTLAIDDLGIARIAIDRPDARNAVTVAAWHALADCARDPAIAGCRVVVLRAAAPGAVFSAGADLRELAALGDEVDRRAPFRAAMAQAFAAIRDIAVPTIAAIDGGCYGAGVALAMACDLRIAARDARFSVPPARLGILYPPDDVRRLAALVGAGHAIRLLASGEVIDAGEAERIGLVELLAEDATDAAEALARGIAVNPTRAVRKLKAMATDPAAHPATDFDDAFGWPEARAALAALRARMGGGPK